MKADKYKNEHYANQLTKFIEGQDSDDHFSLQGDLEIAAIINCESSIHCCRFHPNGQLFVAGLSDGSIKIYKKSNSQLLYTLIDDDIKLTRLPVTCIKFYNPPNHENLDHYQILIATYVSGYIKFWHYPSKSCIYTIVEKEMQPLTVDFNANFDSISVGGYSQEIKIYDVLTKKLKLTLESSVNSLSTNGHSSRVYCVKYHPNEPNKLFSGGWDDTIQIWDDRVSVSQRYIYGPHICGNSLDIDPNYNHLLSGSWRKTSTLQIWDLRQYDLIRDVFKNKSNMMIYSCQWLGKSFILTCGSENNSVVIYDRGTLRNYGNLSELKHAVTCIDNDGIGDVPSMLAASNKTLYLIKRLSMK